MNGFVRHVWTYMYYRSTGTVLILGVFKSVTYFCQDGPDTRTIKSISHSLDDRCLVLLPAHPRFRSICVGPPLKMTAKNKWWRGVKIVGSMLGCYYYVGDPMSSVEKKSKKRFFRIFFRVGFHLLWWCCYQIRQVATISNPIGTRSRQRVLLRAILAKKYVSHRSNLKI